MAIPPLPVTARSAHRWRIPALVALLYFCAAYFSLILTWGPYGTATVWPASGVLLAFLLAEPSLRWPILAAGALGSVTANCMAGASTPLALGFTGANMTESLLASLLILRRLQGERPSFVSARHLRDYAVLCALAAAASGLLATALSGRHSLAFYYSWFATDLLGMLIVGPIVLIAHGALTTPRWLQPVSTAYRWETAGLIGVLTLVTLVTFAQAEYPVLFLPMAAMLFLVLRRGTTGAASGMLIVATISAVATELGKGPALIVHGDDGARILFLQGYLLTLFAVTLPVAALLAQRGRLVDELAERNRMLNLAEHSAQIGHWRLDLRASHLFWSNETYRIHGLVPGTPIDLEDALFAYHPDDRAEVRRVFGEATAAGTPYEFRARVVRPDGEARHILSRGEAERDTTGAVLAMFGMIQDVTRQTEDDRHRENARRLAEESARIARAIAETDPLTGLPNRRKALAVLESALADAELHSTAVSVALMDVDNFKQVNDRLGHAMGDVVLQRVARDAAASLRGTDLVGRFGGEEFLLVLPGAPPETALAVAERVRAAIASSELEGTGGMTVSASLGVATLLPDEAIEALLSRADDALYRAKREGRDRVCPAAATPAAPRAFSPSPEAPSARP